MRGFVRIKLKLALEGRPFRDGTERASPRTEIAQDHERRCSAMEAFMNVRATSRLADRMQVAGPEFRFQEMDGLKMRPALPKPIRQPRTWTRSRLNLDKRIQV